MGLRICKGPFKKDSHLRGEGQSLEGGGALKAETPYENIFFSIQKANKEEG